VRGHADSGHGGFSVAMPVTALLMRFIRAGAAAPRCGGPPGSRSTAGTVPAPGQLRLPAVAAAFVEVSSEISEDVQAGHRGGGGGGDGEDDGGVPCGVPVMGAAGVLPGHDRPADLALREVVIRRDHGVVAVRDDAVPFAVQGGERLLRGFGQARGV
jgi:hypothetical protein